MGFVSDQLSMTAVGSGIVSYIFCFSGRLNENHKRAYRLYKKRSLDAKEAASRPGKPTDDAFIESFNARFRLVQKS